MFLALVLPSLIGIVRRGPVFDLERFLAERVTVYFYTQVKKSTFPVTVLLTFRLPKLLLKPESVHNLKKIYMAKIVTFLGTAEP